MHNEVISVIIPVYKAEKYLRRCLDSVLAQTYSNLEVILIDDGSPDSCPEICDQYSENDHRVKVIHKKNEGVSIARNIGLRSATGSLITFVDSDDYIEPVMYEKMANILMSNNCDIVMCDCIKEFDNKDELYTHQIREGLYTRSQLEQDYFPQLLITESLEYPTTISNWLLLFRYSLQKQNQIFYVEGVRYSEDLLFGSELVFHSNSFFYMKSEAYYHYNCVNELSATHTFNIDKWNDYKKLYSMTKNKFANSSAFDFSVQIDYLLLFFVLNSIGDILTSSELNKKSKITTILSILDDYAVREMFKKIKIKNLKVSSKMKTLIWLYKHRIGLNLLCKYYQ